MTTQSLVYVVDDERDVRQIVIRYLERAGYRTEEFDSAEAFLERVRSDQPACLLLDVHLVHGTGFDLLAEMKRRGDVLPTIFMTGAGDVPMSVRAMKAGALEFLEKPLAFDTLKRAVEQAAAQAIAAAQVREVLDRLTPRERAVLPLVARGLMNKQIAAELDIVEQTVKVHRARVMEKLAAESVPDLVRFVDRAAALGVTVSPDAPGD